MESADQHEVYKRLGERGKPLLDESHKRLEFEEVEPPLFVRRVVDDAQRD